MWQTDMWSKCQDPRTHCHQPISSHVFSPKITNALRCLLMLQFPILAHTCAHTHTHSHIHIKHLRCMMEAGAAWFANAARKVRMGLRIAERKYKPLPPSGASGVAKTTGERCLHFQKPTSSSASTMRWTVRMLTKA